MLSLFNRFYNLSFLIASSHNLSWHKLRGQLLPNYFPRSPNRTLNSSVSLRLNAAALFRRVERVRYAAEKGCLDRRPQSACVQFREDRVFSLDGRRMACDTQPDTVFPVPCLLLGDALTHLRAFGENEVAVQIGAHKVCFSDETLKLYVRRYGVDTYDPGAAIPKAYREVITVKTDELLRELTYLKECIGSCTFPYVRFAGQELTKCLISVLIIHPSGQ